MGAVLFVGDEGVGAVYQLDCLPDGGLHGVADGRVLDAVVPWHKGDVVALRLVVLVRDGVQHGVLLHVQPHAGVMDQIQGEVGQVDVLPRDRQVVVVVVVVVGLVLADALLLCGLEGPVDHDEIPLNEALLEVRDLHGAGNAGAKLRQDLFGEAFAHVLLDRGGLGRGGRGRGRGDGGRVVLVVAHFFVSSLIFLIFLWVNQAGST